AHTARSTSSWEADGVHLETGIQLGNPERAAFPDCPNHPRLSTEWKPLEDDRIRHVSDLFPNKNHNQKLSCRTMNAQYGQRSGQEWRTRRAASYAFLGSSFDA